MTNVGGGGAGEWAPCYTGPSMDGNPRYYIRTHAHTHTHAHAYAHCAAGMLVLVLLPPFVGLVRDRGFARGCAMGLQLEVHNSSFALSLSLPPSFSLSSHHSPPSTPLSLTHALARTLRKYGSWQNIIAHVMWDRYGNALLVIVNYNYEYANGHVTLPEGVLVGRRCFPGGSLSRSLCFPPTRRPPLSLSLAPALSHRHTCPASFGREQRCCCTPCMTGRASAHSCVRERACVCVCVRARARECV